MRFDRRLFRYLKGVRLYLVLTVTLSTLMGILIILQAYYLASIVNAAFLAHQQIQQLEPLLLFLLGVILLRTCLVWGSDVAAHQVAARIKTALRTRLFTHLLTLGPAYTRGERSGELINTLVEGVESLEAYFSQYLPQVFLSVLVPLAVLIATFSVDKLSGIVLLITAPLLPLLMALVGIMASAESKRRWHVLSVMSAHFLDVLQGLTTLKVFGRDKAQVETIRRVSEQYRKVTMETLRVAFLSSVVLEMGATVSTAVVAVEAGLRLLYGNLPFERAFFVLLLAPEFYLPLRQLGTRYHAGLAGSEAAQRILALLDVPVPAQRIAPERVSQRIRGDGVIRFDHVSYTYDGQRPALHDVSFELHPGQKVALVGPSGAGKSTIAQLLLRFIEADQGTISANDVPVTELSTQAWRHQVAWVPQRPYLFNATIAENIRLGKPEATQREVMQAAQLARADAFIEALPERYNSVIGERGTRLSGGEAQRISLARAFLKNAPLLILDEATSNLDPENESKILEALKTLLRGRTTVVIAHRLSTVYDADQIFVLNAGRIVESGTHQELLQHSVTYRQLVHAYGRRYA